MTSLVISHNGHATLNHVEIFAIKNGNLDEDITYFLTKQYKNCTFQSIFILFRLTKFVPVFWGISVQVLCLSWSRLCIQVLAL